jgi:hypothetical protein
MINPLITLRKEAGFSSSRKFAEFIGVNPSFIEQAEYATQTEIPHRYLDGLIQAYPNIMQDSGYTHEILVEAYETFQNLTRRANYGTLRINPNLSAHTHPLTSWRIQSNDLSLHALSRAFCVHLGQLNKFEKEPWTFKEPMASLVKALEISGYNQDLTYFIAVFKDYNKLVKREMVYVNS